MTQSKKNYLFHNLRNILNIHYYKNNINSKCPATMNNDEILVHIEKYNLTNLYAEVMNEMVFKFKSIEDKFENIIIPNNVKNVLDKLLKISKNSYLVGGCVRDIILGETPKDWDFVTDISYENLKKIFKDYSFKETGQNFLVFNLNYNGEDFEIANFRKDSKESDGRHPDSVEKGSIEEDMKRRDFTINNIYWNGELVIDIKSVDDVINRTLRFVGNPDERIKEDYLRGWRAHRLSKTKNLTIEKNTLKAIRRNWDNIYNLSNPHRVMLEIEKLYS